jgi:hypothetical protein
MSVVTGGVAIDLAPRLHSALDARGARREERLRPAQAAFITLCGERLRPLCWPRLRVAEEST